ncbi:MAG TPA: hypothetical protein VIH61_00710 [Waddliaceae bacterium]
MDAMHRRAIKGVIIAVITAVALLAISLTLHFTLKGSPIMGWTVDAFLLITILPGGLISIISQLISAFLPIMCKAQIEQSERKLNEAIDEDARQWAAKVGEAVKPLDEYYKANGLYDRDLITVLREFKAKNEPPLSEEEREVLLMCYLVNQPLTEEERQLCAEFGINPDLVQIKNN